MLHTFELSIPIHHEEVITFQRTAGVPYTKINDFYDGHFKGVKVAISSKAGWRLSFVVDAVEMLGKHKIVESDYQRVESNLKGYLREIIGHANSFKDHTLTRIDYRIDVRVESEVERNLLIHLFRKTRRFYRYQKKATGKIVDGRFEQYETSVYHASKSAEAVVYLKEEERISKGFVPKDFERSVIRFEARLLKGHLNHMVRPTTKNNRPKKLESYWSQELCDHYFTTYFSSIYLPHSFYKLNKAEKLILSSSYTARKKRQLVDFMKIVSSHDIDTPLKTMGECAVKNRIEELNLLGINPIPIPKNFPNAPSCLDNPLDEFPWIKQDGNSNQLA